MEIVLVVFSADHLVERHFGWPMVDPVTLNRVPWHRKGAGVFDLNIHDQDWWSSKSLKRSTTWSFVVWGVR